MNETNVIPGNVLGYLINKGKPCTFQELARYFGKDASIYARNISELQTLAAPLGLVVMYTETECEVRAGPALSTLLQRDEQEQEKLELTPASLSCLTIIAYAGPLLRDHVTTLRGIQSAQSLRILLERGLIEEESRMLTLSREALAHLGVSSVSELPDYSALRNSLLHERDALLTTT